MNYNLTPYVKLLIAELIQNILQCLEDRHPVSCLISRLAKIQKVRVVSNPKAMLLFNLTVKSMIFILFCYFLLASLIGLSDVACTLSNI